MFPISRQTPVPVLALCVGGCQLDRAESVSRDVASAGAKSPVPGTADFEPLVVPTLVGESEYGWALALSGNLVLVGAPAAVVNEVDSGAVYAFSRSAGKAGRAWGRSCPCRRLRGSASA